MDQFGNPFEVFIPSMKSAEDFDSKSLPSSYEELGVIDTKNLNDEEIIFVCFESRGKQRFYLAKPYQIPIIKKICKSTKKDVNYQEFGAWGMVQARGFKFFFKNFPVIGYVNDRNYEVYGIPMKVYGNGGNGAISRFEKGEDGEYLLYDGENNLITDWPKTS